MKTIRLLYPDYVSGGLDTYYFGANLLAHILPENKNQPLIKVDIAQPNSANKIITDGIYAKGEVLSGIQNAMAKIEKENPDKIITIGGNCLVSLAPFDYLHGKYKKHGYCLDRRASGCFFSQRRLSQRPCNGSRLFNGIWR